MSALPNMPQEDGDQVVVHTPKPRFARVPVELMHNPAITDGAVRLYAHMLWRYGKNERNFEGRESMARLLDVSETTITNRIAELAAYHWIVVEPRAIVGGGRLTNIYHIFLRQKDCAEYRKSRGLSAPEKPEPRKSRKGKGGKPAHRTQGVQILQSPKVNSSSPTDVNSGLPTYVNSSSHKLDVLNYVDVDHLDVDSLSATLNAGGVARPDPVTATLEETSQAATTEQGEVSPSKESDTSLTPPVPATPPMVSPALAIVPRATPPQQPPSNIASILHTEDGCEITYRSGETVFATAVDKYPKVEYTPGERVDYHTTAGGYKLPVKYNAVVLRMNKTTAAILVKRGSDFKVLNVSPVNISPRGEDAPPSPDLDAEGDKRIAVDTSLRAMTIKEPYATRIATGEKPYEVRGYATDYRGPIVITVSGEKRAICIVDLTDIVPASSVASLSDEERDYGEWAWKLENPRFCKPVEAKGALSLWRWEGELPEVITAEQYAADRAAKVKPPKAERPTQDHMKPIEAWVEALGKDTLPPDFSYDPFARLSKKMHEGGVSPETMACSGLLVRTWLETLETKPVLTWTVGEVTELSRLAYALCRDGVSSDKVAAFIKVKTAETERGVRFWQGKVMSFKYVADHIRGWDNPTQPTKVQPKHDPNCPKCKGGGLIRGRDQYGEYSEPCDCKGVA